jgi:hypothetical protein
LNLALLQSMVYRVEPAALLIEPRILRRIIRLDQRLPGLGPSLPHQQSYIIERDRLLAFVDRFELEMLPGTDLARTVILLAKPNEDEYETVEGADKVVRNCARRLYHATVHVELERSWAEVSVRDTLASERQRQIGTAEFTEIRNVLLKDHFLFSAATDLEVYSEFAAVYLELRYFAPAELPIYFPAVRDWDEIDRTVRQDLDHSQLFQRLRFETLPSVLSSENNTESVVRTTWRPPPVRPVTLLEFRKLQARAERASLLGNGIKAAIWHTRAARVAPAEHAAEAHISASGELTRFAQRLQQALQLDEQTTAAWRTALQPLLLPASVGYWANEARLLYDLQKVCVERERGVYRLDLIEWVRTLGQRPLRRPLPLLRDASMIRYLRLATRRVATARIRREEREHLETLLTSIVQHVERDSRDRIRPLIAETLDEVNFVPTNVPESVARKKLVEELLDRVVESSQLNMGDLRDTLSKNDLKLPDVTSPRELLRGDQLLRADRKLDEALDGIYRRGAIYRRWPQLLSSLAFGTPFGRFLTSHVAVPFGGAYLAAEFFRHVMLGLAGHSTPSHADLSAGEAIVDVATAGPSWLFYAGVLALGSWISLLVHRPLFRAWNMSVLKGFGRFLHRTFIELPSRVLHSQLVQWILHSPLYTLVQRYFMVPATISGLVWLPFKWLGRADSNRLLLEIFLVMSLVLNSSLGRYATEVTTDFLFRAWRELTIRIFTAILQSIVEAFEGLFSALEQLLYTVDEWLRFRTGDNRLSQTVKLLGGVVWFFVSYIIMFVFTLLVEPQINPIKHFPVVTVAHKVILPTGPMFVNQLTPYLGKAEANTLVWTTIWLVPGVFGFLVWELKENWRLYAANRPRTLKPVAIGRHGETMARLLLPGFHSGTLPKAFAALRRAIRKIEDGEPARGVGKRQGELRHVVEAIQRFVERDLICLLDEVEVLPGMTVQVGKIRVATNLIDVELRPNDQRNTTAILTWEDRDGALRGSISRAGWLEILSGHERQMFVTALAGLFQRAGVEQTGGELIAACQTPIAWDRWTELWSAETGTTKYKQDVEPTERPQNVA